MVDLQHTGRTDETAIYNAEVMDDAGIQYPGVQFEVENNHQHPVARDVPDDVADWLQDQDDQIKPASDVDSQGEAEPDVEPEPEPELDQEADSPEREAVPIAADNDADGTQPQETPTDEQRAENAVVGGADDDVVPDPDPDPDNE